MWYRHPHQGAAPPAEWAGAIERVYDENGKKKKVQGTVRGILKAVGFTEDMVYKY